MSRYYTSFLERIKILKSNNKIGEGTFGTVYIDDTYAYKVSKNKTAYNSILAEGLLYKYLGNIKIGPDYYGSLILKNIEMSSDNPITENREMISDNPITENRETFSSFGFIIDYRPSTTPVNTKSIRISTTTENTMSSDNPITENREMISDNPITENREMFSSFGSIIDYRPSTTTENTKSIKTSTIPKKMESNTLTKSNTLTYLSNLNNNNIFKFFLNINIEKEELDKKMRNIFIF